MSGTYHYIDILNKKSYNEYDIIDARILLDDMDLSIIDIWDKDYDGVVQETEESKSHAVTLCGYLKEVNSMNIVVWNSGNHQYQTLGYTEGKGAILPYNNKTFIWQRTSSYY